MNKFMLLLFLYVVSTIALILAFSAFNVISKENYLDIVLFCTVFNSIIILLVISIIKILK